MVDLRISAAQPSCCLFRCPSPPHALPAKCGGEGQRGGHVAKKGLQGPVALRPTLSGGLPLSTTKSNQASWKELW